MTTITGFTVTQDEDGSNTATYRFKYTSSYTYTIFAASNAGVYYEKDSGVTDNNVTGTIVLDEFRTYDIKLEIYDPASFNVLVETAYTTVTMSEGEPSISLSVSTNGLNVSFSWKASGVSDYAGMTVRIRYSLVEPESKVYYGNAYSNAFSGNSSGVITATMLEYGVYEADIYLYDNSGEYLESSIFHFYSVTVVDPPDKFTWTYTKTQGQEFNLTANEWNSFTDRINLSRECWGFKDYDFSVAIKGAQFLAVMFNEAVEALNEIWSQITGNYKVYAVSKGDKVTADYLNGIVKSLNHIIGYQQKN